MNAEKDSIHEEIIYVDSQKDNVYVKLRCSGVLMCIQIIFWDLQIILERLMGVHILKG